MEEPSYRAKDGLLLDLSDEHKVTISQALISGAEFDDTFGLYNKIPVTSSVPPVYTSNHVNGSHVTGQGDINQQRQEADENGNPVNSLSFDMDIMNIDDLPTFPSFMDAHSTNDETFEVESPIAEGHVNPSLDNIPSPETLHTRALEIQAIWEKIKAEDISMYQVRPLKWTAEDIPGIISSRSRATEIAAEIHQLFEHASNTLMRPRSSASQGQQSQQVSPVTSPVQDESPKVMATPPRIQTFRPDSAPPSPIPHHQGTLSKDSSLSLRSLNAEGSKGQIGLRRTQSCVTAPRQFLPPIAASSPRPRAADLNRSSSTDGPNGLYRQNSFKKSISNVRSSGYGRPATASNMPPPSPKFAPSPVRARSRNSVAGFMSSPQREAPGTRPLNRATPTRTLNTSKVNLDSTFVKGNGVGAGEPRTSANTTMTGMTFPKIIRPGQSTSTIAALPAPRNGKIDLNVTQIKSTGSSLPISRVPPTTVAPPTASKKEDISRMMNKFGFRK